MRRIGAFLVLLLAALTVGEAAADQPRRIVSLAPAVTETLFALGVGSRVVGVSDFCDYPAEATRLPRVGSFLSPSVEAVLALEPDLVIGNESPGNRAPVEAMRRAGLRVEIVTPHLLGDLPVVTRKIAAFAGVPAAGEELVARMEGEMGAVRERVAGAPRRRTLMVVGQSPLVAVGGGTYLGEMLVEAGAINVAPAGGAWPRLGIEYVIAADPEVVIDSSMGTEQSATPEFWTRIGSLTAVREGRVYPFRSFHVLRPGPRLPTAFADLARLIHPERWP
jgi:iron complex transport system substrate-binding protein